MFLRLRLLMRRWASLWVWFTTLCVAAPAAAWQPTEPVEIIVPAGRGGGADQMARLLERAVAKHALMDQRIVVVNKSGGDGAEGLLHMKASAGNPHKLLMAMSNLFTTPRATGIAFSHRDLTPVGMLALDQFMLWVHGDAPYETAQQFFDAVRAAPHGTFRVGGTGLKEEDHLVAFEIEKRLGRQLSYVAFRGGAEVAAQLASRRVAFTVNNPLEAFERWRSGEVRPLCVFRPERLPHTKKLSSGRAWSEIPSCRSAGVELTYQMLRGLFLPAGASPDVVTFYADLLQRVRALPEWRDFLETGAFDDRFMTGRPFVEWLDRTDAEHAAWMREANLLAGKTPPP
jgi:putative tricarboxylic transport membrane protein